MGEDPKGESLVRKCLGRFKKLRVLELGDTRYEVVPKRIGALKHLRYLDLSDNSKIKKLPNSICKLPSLIFLDFSDSGIERLPKDMRYMIGLTTLGLSTKLKDLSEAGLEHLKSLRLLSIDGCENLEYLFDGIENLTFLHTLLILSCKKLISLPRGLKSSAALKLLIVGNCEKLDLTMTGRGKEDNLVGSGGLSLQTLIISGLPTLEVVPQWLLAGSANTLQTLFVEECENLTSFHDKTNFTSLQQVVFQDCPNLSSLQLQKMSCLEYFRINRCPILSERFNPESGEDWANIAHVSSIIIDDEEISSNKPSSA